MNLSKSRIINSIGVSVMIEIIEKVKALEGGVAFCCLTPTTAKTFRIMGLLNASTIHETEEEAIDQITGKGA
jgi:anti-anti-sigma factor